MILLIQGFSQEPLTSSKSLIIILVMVEMKNFADFFYKEDGSLGIGSIILRIIAVGLGVYATLIFRKKQNQCSINPRRKKLNLILLMLLLTTFGVSFFLAFESLSSWYFDKYIVPQQQLELNIN